MTVEVKGGVNVTIESLRALKGVLDYDNALMAGLISEKRYLLNWAQSHGYADPRMQINH